MDNHTINSFNKNINPSQDSYPNNEHSVNHIVPNDPLNPVPIVSVHIRNQILKEITKNINNTICERVQNQIIENILN